MSDNRDWQADRANMHLYDQGELYHVALYYHQQYAAEKQRADIAESAYHGLQEDVVTMGEYQSLLDKHTAMTKAHRVEKQRADMLHKAYSKAVTNEQKLKEAIEAAINEKAQWGDAGNALDVIVRYLSETLSELYPAVMDKEAEA